MSWLIMRQDGIRTEKGFSKMVLINIDSLCNGNDNRTHRRHGALLPNHVRCITCGPSSCGKSNLLINLILNPRGLCFENVYIFSKTLYQPKYKFLAKLFEPLYPEIGYYTFSDNEQVPHPNDIETDSVMIFDDISTESQESMRNYFTMGRHKDLDTFYLSQTYSKIPKQLIRDNANLIIIFRQDEMNLHHVFSDHVNPDMTFQKFLALCQPAWENDRGFLTIDKESDLNNG